MPPKKKKAVKAVVKKKATTAPAKRPVGRPRKELGTRVSDSNDLLGPLANVGLTKPMPRRIGRDALEQQRARLRFARDYPGQRFTEQMTRALQDSFSTGMLPYGVSLRAAEPFARKYKTSFAPIAGMPVWPASNTFPTGPPGRGPPLRRSIASGPGPGDAGRFDDLEALLDEEARPTGRQLLARTTLPNARQISRRSAIAIKKELDELSTRRTSVASTRESLSSLLSAPTSGRSSSAASSTTSRISDDQIKKLEAAMKRLVRKEAEAVEATEAYAKEEPRLVTNRPQRPQRPRQPLSSISGLNDEIARLQQSVENANRALAQPRPRSSAEVERLGQERDENIERIRYLLGSIDTSPQAQQMVVSVPSVSAVSDELSMLEERASVIRQQLALKRAGRSLAGAKRELESILERQRQILNETGAATPSSDPAPASVQQSIPIPGTEQAFQQELVRSQEAIRLENAALRQQQEQFIRGTRAREAEIAAEKSRANVERYKATAPSVERLQEQIAEDPSSEVVGVSPEELDAIQSFVTATIASNKGYKPGTIEALMAAKKKIDIEKRNQLFQRQAEAVNRANSQIADPTKTPSELRTTAALQVLGRSARERLLAEANRRDPDARILSEPAAPTVPTLTAKQLAMVSQAVETERAPAQTVQIPPATNPPEQQSELAIADPNASPTVNGTGLQHVTAATFPASKWTTASSLRWLRSNGLHPIRKSTKINGAYSYALQSPAAYSSFNSVKMSHKNKDFTIVYGTPK